MSPQAPLGGSYGPPRSPRPWSQSQSQSQSQSRPVTPMTPTLAFSPYTCPASPAMGASPGMGNWSPPNSYPSHDLSGTLGEVVSLPEMCTQVHEGLGAELSRLRTRRRERREPAHLQRRPEARGQLQGKPMANRPRHSLQKSLLGQVICIIIWLRSLNSSVIVLLIIGRSGQAKRVPGRRMSLIGAACQQSAGAFLHRASKSLVKLCFHA